MSHRKRSPSPAGLRVFVESNNGGPHLTEWNRSSELHHTSMTTGGLHKRSTAATVSSGRGGGGGSFGEDGTTLVSSSATLRQSFTDRYRERARKRQNRYHQPKRSLSVGGCLLMVLIVGIPLYLIIAVAVWWRTSLPLGIRSFHSATLRTIVHMAKASDKRRGQRARIETHEASERVNVKQTLRERAAERRMGTIPKQDVAGDFVFHYDVHLPDRLQRMPKPPSKKKDKRVEMGDLCGYLAQSAYLSHQESYTEPLSSQSSVLVTGILGSIGLHVALALKEWCGVQIITGVDAMFPNTLQNRMDMVTPMAILTRSIPKLSKPLLTSHIGVDPPKPPRKTMTTLEVTGELDYCDSYKPTHVVHMASSAAEYFRAGNLIPPERRNTASPYVDNMNDPPFYAIRSSLIGIEQLLASISLQSTEERPQLLYASSNLFHGQSSVKNKQDILYGRVQMMTEIVADFYYAEHDVYSIALRLPNAVYGPWTHPESSMSNVFNHVMEHAHDTNATRNDEIDQEDRLDLIHVDDVVDTIIAALQFRSTTGSPIAFDITSGGTLDLPHVHRAVNDILTTDPSESSILVRPPTEYTVEQVARGAAREYLNWNPRIPVVEGLVRTFAWYLDQRFPYGHSEHANGDQYSLVTGDELLFQHGLSTCSSDDLYCHREGVHLPCSSECAIKSQCSSSLLDSVVETVHDSTEGCDIVLYTLELGSNVADLRLHSEYMAETTDDELLICNIAFVSRESPLVETVIQRVPDAELKKLGVVPSAESHGTVDSLREAKIAKLNGRLLFRGWILIWPAIDTPDIVEEQHISFLKLAPGNFFSKDVRYAMFLDQSFTVSPSVSDILFLVNEMHREAWPVRLVKRKTRPKAKFLLPPEPARKAVMLLSELKFQESSAADRLPPETKITVYEASRFMRFENGEDPLGKEPLQLKAQREFYERLPSIVNRDVMRPAQEPTHKLEFSYWARTRWVIHDLKVEEARQLRCDWLKEHLLWNNQSPSSAAFDQLSLAYVMAKRDILRKLAHNEPDETIQKALSEKTEMKKLLSDTFEWHALQTDQNKLYSPYEEMKVLPYEIDYTVDQDSMEVLDNPLKDKPLPLYVRIMSDRIMAHARKLWNDRKELDELEREIRAKDVAANQQQSEEPRISEADKLVGGNDNKVSVAQVVEADEAIKDKEDEKSEDNAARSNSQVDRPDDEENVQDQISEDDPTKKTVPDNVRDVSEP